ncbi:hypothetical protein SSS_10028 [Sarcoptes scabiei]|nr:hypothetical protein SSS_10028 [Sarcoptes scabiei]
MSAYNKTLFRRLGPLISTILALLLFTRIAFAVPPENCLLSHQCTTYCHSFGYSQATCRTRFRTNSLSIPVLKRFCHCSRCDSEHCRNYCQSIGRKYSGCSCFNFSHDHRYESILFQH